MYIQSPATGSFASKNSLGTRFKARNCNSEPGPHAEALQGHFFLKPAQRNWHPDINGLVLETCEVQ
jgi:hypothetical protein